MSPSLLVQIFASLGHGLMHLLAVYFYLVALPLEREWQRPYSELITLWTAGSFLVGAVAIPAGWLADRWSARGMMAISFLGLGVSAIGCGLALGPGTLWLALCALGIFAAIYHPVGLPLLVRTAGAAKGRAIGINGIFGSAGVAGAGAVAGALIQLSGWRTAFIVPGIVCFGLGLAMVALIRAGRLPEDAPSAGHAVAERAGPERARLFRVLFLTMAAEAIVYQSIQAALPKMLSLRTGGSDATLGVGLLVGLVYGVAALSQIQAGHMADRFPLKSLYVGAFVLQVPVLWLMAWASGTSLVVLAILALIFNTGALPAENLLLSQSASRGRQGVTFGAKFVMSFGATPAAIWLVSLLSGREGGFALLFVVLAGVAAAGTLAALLVPGDAAAVRRAPAAEDALSAGPVAGP